MSATEVDLRNSSSMVAGESDLGSIAVAIAGGQVTGVVFGHRSPREASMALSRRIESGVAADAREASADFDEQLAADVLERLQQFAAGAAVDLNSIAVSLDHLSTFQRRVVKACRAIRRGDRRSYGQVAATAGSYGAARAVGQVMRMNRTPLIVPCHRVVAAGGKLGGFSAPQGLAMKRRLLALEETTVFD